jgi:hypothetical protein
MTKIKSPRWITSDTAAYNKDVKLPKHITPTPESTDNHQLTSFVKSGLRILGLVAIPFTLPVSLTLLILAEIVGVIEEMV